MNISDIELCLVEIPRAGGARTVRSLVVALTTDSGLVGWGEAACRWQQSEAAGRQGMLVSHLTGRSMFEIEELLRLEVLRDRPLAGAVEIACWDLIGKAARQPLCHLSGGSYRKRIPLAVRLTPDSPREVAQLAREMAELGFHAQVISATGVLERDLEVLRAACEAAGERGDIRFDGGGAFTRRDARDACGELEQLGVTSFIDPVQPQDAEYMASLRRLTNVPLAAWRTIRGPADVLTVARSGAASRVVIDPVQIGGLLATRKCAAVAEAAQLEMLLAAEASLGIGVAALAHLAAAIPNLAAANHCGYHELSDDILRTPLEILDGLLAVPAGPGLGIEIDRAKLERYQVG